MSRQGTWADNLIIQAVADALNLKIIIIESDPKFADFNTIEATNPQQESVVVYIGHIGEVHYMSTKKCISNQTVQQTRRDSNNEMSASDSFLNCKHINSVTGTRKRPAVCCLESCKNHACVQKQNTATCSKCILEDEKQKEVKKKRHAEYMRQYRLKQTPEDKKKQAAGKQKSRLKQTANKKRTMLPKCANIDRNKLNKKHAALLMKGSITYLIP